MPRFLITKMDILNNLCRVCNIKKERLVNIYDIEESSKLIKSKLEYCLQTTLKEELKYPKFICYDCVKQLEISYRFIKRFQLSRTEFEESHKCLQRHYSGKVDLHILNSAETQYVDIKKCPLEASVNSKNTIDNAHNVSSITSIPIKIEHALKINYISECPAEERKSTEICPLCNKMFFTKKALNLHTKLSHKQNIEYLK